MNNATTSSAASSGGQSADARPSGTKASGARVFTLVRIGNRPEVTPWLFSEAFLARSDCAVSLYVDQPPASCPQHVRQHHFIGGKWTGIFDFFRQNPDIVDAYDYFWFPDDDIESTPEDVCRFLDIAEREGFRLAQPALTPDSDHADRITLANPRFEWRRTNFVELMLPLMHREVLKKVLPLFEGRHFGLGLDWIWHLLTEDPAHQVAIVDAVPVGHRRPRRKHLKQNMQQIDVDIASERKETLGELAIRRARPVVLSAKTREGGELRRGTALWRRYFAGQWQTRRAVTGRPWTVLAAVLSTLDQLTGNPARASFDRESYRRIVARGGDPAVRSDGHTPD